MGPFQSGVPTMDVRGEVLDELHGAHRTAGSTVGRYVLAEVLGDGGMGIVYAARDPQLDRRVAIKLLHARLAGADQTVMELRLAREAQAMARLSHPNVLTIFDLGIADDGQVFMAMELVEGGTLKQWLNARPRRCHEVLAMFLDAGEGLAAAHKAGIIHRDFKPDNVLLGSDGRPRVTDFGLAYAVASVRGPSATGGASSIPPPADLPRKASTPPPRGVLARPLTVAGAVMGTPGYMAPEQFRAALTDERTDVYCFCASLYHALYGERAFQGETFDEMSEAVQAGVIREAPSNTRVPPWLRKVLVSGLAVDLAARPPSMRVLLRALRRDPARVRRRIAALGGLAVAAMMALLVHHEVGERQSRVCRALPQRLAGVWDDARKETIARRFVASRASFANEAWQSVHRSIDAYAAEWSTMSVAACEAARVRGDESEALYEQRTACLDERLDGLRALTEVFVGADAKAVRKAPEATLQLDELSTCGDAARLGSIPLLPTDPARRRTIDDLRRDVQRAQALKGAGQLRQSVALLHGIGDRVQQAGYAPLKTEWALRLAAYEHSQDQGAAVADFEKAILLADANRLDHLRAEGDIRLGSLLGNQLGRPEEGHAWLRQAGAIIDRLGGDPALAAMRDVHEAWMFHSEWKLKEAAVLFERGLAEVGEAAVHDVTIRAGAYSGLADCRGAEGRLDEAVALNEKALGMLVGALGSHDDATFVIRLNLGVSLSQAGRGEEGLDRALGALDTLNQQIADENVQPGSWYEATGTRAVGEVFLRIGRLAEARDMLLRAIEIFRRLQDMELVATLDNDLAQTYRRLERLDDAHRCVADAEDVERRHAGLAAETRSNTLKESAMLLLPREPAEAAALLEQALTLGAQVEPHDRAEDQLALADALGRSHAQPERAQSLAQTALATFQRLHDREATDTATRVLARAK